MSEKDNKFRHKFYAIIGLLFLVVIVLWLYLGGWQKQFSLLNSGRDNNKTKANLFSDLPGLWEKSTQQFYQLAPDAKNKKDVKQYITNVLLDEALKSSIQYKGITIRYPDKWAVLENVPSSTLMMIALDGEKYFVNSFETSTSTDPIGSWHNYKKENILGWSWLKVGDGFVGNKIIENGKKNIGLYQLSTTTILTIERESIQLDKLKDGMLETIVSGLRK